MDDIDAAKSELRARVRARRRERAGRPDAAALRSAADAALAGAVAAYLARLVTDRRVCRVALYDARPAEPPTAATIARLREAGHEVVLPVVLAGDPELDWDLDGHRLGPGAPAGCDLVLTPGLAVDRAGRRLGQGGGYYDRALGRVRPGAPIVTMLWDEELLDEPVPTGPHDRPVDGVVTPARGVVLLSGGSAVRGAEVTPSGRG